MHGFLIVDSWSHWQRNLKPECLELEKEWDRQPWDFGSFWDQGDGEPEKRVNPFNRVQTERYYLGNKVDIPGQKETKSVPGDFIPCMFYCFPLRAIWALGVKACQDILANKGPHVGLALSQLSKSCPVGEEFSMSLRQEGIQTIYGHLFIFCLLWAKNEDLLVFAIRSLAFNCVARLKFLSLVHL